MNSADFVFQVYGAQAIFDECRYALLSLQHWADRQHQQYKVWIYTDRPGAFDDFRSFGLLEIQTLLLDRPTLTKWRGKIDFVHRVKIELLLDLFNKTDRPLIYLDTDTFFTRSPEELMEMLSRGERIMHLCEGQIQKRGNPVLKKLDRFLRQNSTCKSLIPQYFEQPVFMWNAGVLGLDPKTDQPLLQKVLELTDQLHELYPKHVVEQFAFSYVLQHSGALHAAEPYIHHYWNFKEFRDLLSQFYLKCPRLAEQQQHWQKLNLPELEKPKRAYEALPGWRRALRKIRKNRWQMPPMPELN